MYAAHKASYNGWKNSVIVLRHGETIVGGGVVFRRPVNPERCFYYMPDGPAFLEGDSDAEKAQVFNAIMASIERHRENEEQVVSHLSISPRWERVPGFVDGFHESGHCYGWPSDTQCIDLTPSEEDILVQMKPKGRYNIGLARRHGVSVVEDVSPEGMAEFIDIYKDTHARKNIRATKAEYFRTFIPLIAGSGSGSIFFAEYLGARVAAALVVYFGHSAMYYYGGSRSAHRNVMAPYLLHFEIIRRAKALGCECYDFGGVAPQGAPDGDWTDISVFKRKFGGREVRFVPTLERIYDASAYREWEDRERHRRSGGRDGPGENHATEAQA